MKSYYLTPLEWSSTNLLAVSIDQHLKILNVETENVIELDKINLNNPITCLSWMHEVSSIFFDYIINLLIILFHLYVEILFGGRDSK
jgi:hypothetical protein